MPRKKLRIITNEEIRNKVIEYYEAGRLTAQTSKILDLIDSQGNRCAIGTALTEDECRNGPCLVTALHNKVVKFADKNYARNVQVAHDFWARGEGNESKFLNVVLNSVDFA